MHELAHRNVSNTAICMQPINFENGEHHLTVARNVNESNVQKNTVKDITLRSGDIPRYSEWESLIHYSDIPRYNIDKLGFKRF